MEEYNTLKYYDDNADDYFKQTINGDMSEIYNRFLKLLPNNAFILDYGCGSGRDTKYFLDNGYRVVAIDGSKELCKLASNYTGIEVKCMKFDELSDVNMYDGIWACSSILHVEREKLKDILKIMIRALKENGIILINFKIGENPEIKEGKYYNNMTRDLFIQYLYEADPSFELIDYFECGLLKNINRPSSRWENYILKRKK